MRQSVENQVVPVQAADLYQSRRLISDLATWCQCFAIINPQRMREGYSTHCVCLCVYVCVCVCVSLTTLEATLIYSAKNGHQWTANGILFILKKLKFRKSAPLIQKQPSKLTALYRTMATPTY